VRRLLIIALIATACGDGGDPQLPPDSASAMSGWLSAGHYLQWRCEPEPHPSRNGSPHGNNRICSNSKISGNADSAYPVGAATVKELVAADNSVAGHSVMRKLNANGDGSAWYFFERFEGRLYAQSAGSTACAGCHERAGSGGMPGKDFVFSQID
jgi:hypothetical protein